MRVGVAEARRRFREILNRVRDGETVEILRRDAVVAVVGPPPRSARTGLSLGSELAAWRDEWSVAGWPDDDPFGDLRDRIPGRDAPW